MIEVSEIPTWLRPFWAPLSKVNGTEIPKVILFKMAFFKAFCFKFFRVVLFVRVGNPG